MKMAIVLMGLVVLTMLFTTLAGDWLLKSIDRADDINSKEVNGPE